MAVYRVMKIDGKWIVKKDGNERASAKASEKSSAMKKARRIASSGDHIVDHRATDNTVRGWREVR